MARCRYSSVQLSLCFLVSVDISLPNVTCSSSLDEVDFEMHTVSDIFPCSVMLGISRGVNHQRTPPWTAVRQSLVKKQMDCQTVTNYQAT